MVDGVLVVVPPPPPVVWGGDTIAAEVSLVVEGCCCSSPSVVAAVVAFSVTPGVVPSGGRTLIISLAVANPPTESCTLNSTSLSPGCSNVWHTFSSSLLAPSSKSQLYLYGGTPSLPVTKLGSKHQVDGASVPSWISLVI